MAFTDTSDSESKEQDNSLPLDEGGTVAEAIERHNDLIE